MFTPAKTTDELVRLIRSAYPATGGPAGFLTDAGGWLAHLDLIDPALTDAEADAVALDAIAIIESEDA